MNRTCLPALMLFAPLLAALLTPAVHGEEKPMQPVKLIFDTDMGNDIDDALALGVIHALQTRNECELLAVMVSKDNPYAVRYCDVVNHFYGRGDIPIGRVRLGKTPEAGKFIQPPVDAVDDGKPRYPHKLKGEDDTPNATELYREILAAQPDGSVIIVVVGFSTNLARLLESPADDYSELSGRDLVAKKVKQLSMMAGQFVRQGDNRRGEYNVVVDLEAADKVFTDWPTPIVASGWEIGKAIEYPAESIINDYNYVAHHPLKEGYELYIKMPYDRPTWDLTSVLDAVRPNRGYFGTSSPGEITIGEENFAVFAPGGHERHRYLTVTDEQVTRVREALIMLASQPPAGFVPAAAEEKAEEKK